ncbi:VPP1-like protein [Mya arenaria]|uniref:V-type proton ATPase subunit a n=1 Tax=Mya arenaria TaxID=6604 RepID=A0ABY7DG62_MYAAR|nr:VPP1-like protein [Mya arenaria]
MGSLFRSEEMTLCQLFLQSDAAYACVSELGEMGLVQFKDLNPDVNAFQRKFVNEIMRCEEMERKLRYIEKELKKDKLKIPDSDSNPKAPAPKEMIDLEATFEKIESELREVNTNAEALKRNYLELTELKEVLTKTQTFFREQGHGHHNVVEDAQHALVPEERVGSGDAIHKSVFIVFFQGEQLKARVRKICEGFRATLYPCPETAQERMDMLRGVTTRLEDLEIVKKIKAIYHTLNMCSFEHSRNNLIAECWAPAKVLEEVQAALRHGQDIPPTYFMTNRFTKVFQSIVHAYGVAGYREVNPALYTIISFPFLFAVMFGDTGHGFIMFLFGLWMVVSEKKLDQKKNDNEIFKMMFGGRYIILLMGLFSLYTGLIYNDIFSKSLNLFGSSWKFNYTQETLDGSFSLQMKPEDIFDDATTGAYPLGLDPVWQASINKITFTNSFKMKLSVIMGVLQMASGVLLSVFNHLHFKHYSFVLVQFVPEILFLLCIFGYLLALIFFKWLTINAHCASCAPSLLIHFINMFLYKYEEPANINGTVPAFHCDNMGPFGNYSQFEMKCTGQTVFYPHQRKAGLGARSHEHLVSSEVLPGQEGLSASEVDISTSVSINGGRGDAVMTMEEEEEGDAEAEFDTGEVFVGQAIHTIEYCLGCVSHTASYLRLWALSLAHAQLSEVLWNMLFRMGLKMDLPYVGSILVFACFGAFAVLTIAVLLVMEGLSAFLHALRLHWVEFQSKFYHGDGYLFDPFNFKEQMDPTLDDQ